MRTKVEGIEGYSMLQMYPNTVRSDKLRANLYILQRLFTFIIGGGLPHLMGYIATMLVYHNNSWFYPLHIKACMATRYYAIMDPSLYYIPHC